MLNPMIYYLLSKNQFARNSHFYQQCRSQMQMPGKLVRKNIHLFLQLLLFTVLWLDQVT